MNTPILTDKTSDLSRIALHALIAVLATIVVASIIGHNMIGLNHDHLSLMHSTMALLDGKTPYESYADINPPLIHLIYALPTLISTITQIPAYIALNLWITALILLSLTCSFKLLGKHHTTYAKAIITLCLATALTLIAFHHQVFADRDHIFFTCITPWLLLNSPLCDDKTAPKAWRYLAAFMAAIAMALKPHFMLLYPLLILFQAHHTPIKQQLRQTEHNIIWFCAGAYLCVIGIFFRNYLSEQFLLIFYTYPYYSWPDASKLATLKHLFFQLWPTLILFAAAFCFCKNNKRLLAYTLLLQVSGITIYWLNAGWYYTQYTLLAANTLMIAASGYVIIAQLSKRNTLKIITYTTLAALFFITHAQAAYTRAISDIHSQKTKNHPINFTHIRASANAELIKYIPKNAKIMFLSTHVRSLSVVQQNPTYTALGRYDHLWPLPGLTKLENTLSNKHLYTTLQKRFSRGITADIMNGEPDYIIIETSPRQPPLADNYNIVKYLRQYHPFTVVMSRYKNFHIIDTCGKHNKIACAFKLFKHKKYIPSCRHQSLSLLRHRFHGTPTSLQNIKHIL